LLVDREDVYGEQAIRTGEFLADFPTAGLLQVTFVAIATDRIPEPVRGALSEVVRAADWATGRRARIAQHLAAVTPRPAHLLHLVDPLLWNGSCMGFDELDVVHTASVVIVPTACSASSGAARVIQETQAVAFAAPAPAALTWSPQDVMNDEVVAALRRIMRSAGGAT
jgi:hypothetical protein